MLSSILHWLSKLRPSPRLGAMVRLGWHMMAGNKLKTAGTVFGVIFATILANQQLGIFFGLLYKNTMFVQQAGADIWITPPNTNIFQPGQILPRDILFKAKALAEIEWAEPLVLGAGSLSRPDGGTEGVSLVGTAYPQFAGGPWNIVAGRREDLLRPGAIFIEDGERKKYGFANLGDIRELNKKRVIISGFTWGLTPFAPAYGFATIETARDILRLGPDDYHFVLIKLKNPADTERVRKILASHRSDFTILTKNEFVQRTVNYLIKNTGIGASFATSTTFALLIGLIVVSLSMFSSVIDNIREFGTLKAIGATNTNLALLLVIQALIFGVAGSIIGLAIVSRIAAGIRSAALALVLPSWLTLGTIPVMVVMCLLSSLLALARIRKIEPGMVFR